MSYEQKRSPEHGRSDGEMVLQVASSLAILRFRIAAFIAAHLSKAFIRELVVVSEVEVVFDQRSTRVGVVTDAIAADPGIQQRKGQTEDTEQDYLESTLLGFEWRLETHEAMGRRYTTSHAN